jgi:hypothetical protein
MWNHCKLYYETAKKIKFPKDDVLFVHNDIYDHKLLFEYSVFAFYIGETNIHHEMTKLMNSGHHAVYQLFNNYKFYCPNLQTQKTICLSDSFTRDINGENYNFRSSTPSIIKYNGAYALNLRYVNYNIQPNGIYDWVNNIVSINKFIELNADFQEIKRTEIEMELGTEKYEGIEDVRLMPCDEKIYFTMARGSTNGYKYNDEIWFVVHFVHQIDGEPRFYYNMFVKFNEDMTDVHHSVPLKFSNQPIEYCCGLIVEENRIIVSHSTWDRESYIKIYDKKHIETFFADL